MKKRSGSLVLAERIRQRQAVTPSKYEIRQVNISPAEMACDPSAAETDDWMPVGRGPAAIGAKPTKVLIVLWRQKLAAARDGYVRIDDDLRKKFKDEASVNRALRTLIEAMPSNAIRRRQKSA